MSQINREELKRQLDEVFPLSEEAIRHFREKGYVKLKGVLSPEVIEYYGAEITRMVHLLNTETRPLDQRDTYGKAFLQVMNIWTKSEVAREFAFSRRLARIAAELMGVAGVRMYHDQALYKEPGGGITPWHADQFYWPLSNGNTCTVWIPLQETPLEMGPLAFSIGSHRFEKGRDLEISDESERQMQFNLRNFPIDETPYELGEVSYHYGWTFHRAGANKTDRPRAVMTVIYMEDGIRLIEPQRKAHVNDWHGWLPGVKIGEPAASPINPVLYSS
ncbi:MAG: phytanoyl-CoA dioxygenase family protein [Anaerolineae bacterium]|nr:phytanoyl-CoA dioxygenase family protein [Thermoflexales bacterium]MDW8406380.1 phytanoyl-CoA dioxygenase family protein [Anaerolineae bacterium]